MQSQLVATEDQVKVLREDNNRLEAALAVERGGRDPDALKKAHHELHLVSYKLARVMRIFDEFKVKRPDPGAELREFATDEYLRQIVANVEERMALQSRKRSTANGEQSAPPETEVAMLSRGVVESDGAVVLEAAVESSGAVVLEDKVAPESKGTTEPEQSGEPDTEMQPETVGNSESNAQPDLMGGSGATTDVPMTDAVNNSGGNTEPRMAVASNDVPDTTEQPESSVVQNVQAEPSIRAELALPADRSTTPSQGNRNDSTSTLLVSPPIVVDETNPAAEVLKILIGAASVIVYDAPRKVKVEMVNEEKQREVSFFLSWSEYGMTFSKDVVRLEERDWPDFLNEDCIEFDFSQAPTFLVLVMSAVHGFTLQQTGENIEEPRHSDEPAAIGASAPMTSPNTH